MYKKLDEVIIFTDGACSGNGKNNAKAGIGVYFPNQEFSNISKKFVLSPITNQRAELYAIYEGLQLIINNSTFNKITIYSDSLYSIKSLTEWIKNWEKCDWKTASKTPVKNLDILKPINDILVKYEGKIFFKHVKSHTKNTDYGSLGNAQADILAVGGINVSDKIKVSI